MGISKPLNGEIKVVPDHISFIVVLKNLHAEYDDDYDDDNSHFRNLCNCHGVISEDHTTVCAVNT